MGLLGLRFDEAHGGSGGSATGTMIVAEAFGRGLVLEPWLATVVLGAECIRLGGTAAQRDAILPDVAAGSLLLALAHAERESRYDLADVAATARPEGGGWVLDGTKSFVLHGDCADRLLVSARVSGARTDRHGIGLFLVDATAAGVTRQGYVNHDGIRAAEIGLAGVRVAAGEAVGEPGEALPLIERVVHGAIAALCAEAVGAMAYAHETTLEYLKTRRQFGVPIGSFQALQHRAVEVFIALEQARSMAYYATMMADEPDAVERAKAMSAAKVQIGRSGRFVGQQAIQLHGAIGMTFEYRIGHYFRRLTMIDLLFGDTDHHLAQLARLGGLIAPAQGAAV
jgi:pimeloyl-CoA dehydrogenase small subunit